MLYLFNKSQVNVENPDWISAVDFPLAHCNDGVIWPRPELYVYTKQITYSRIQTHIYA